MDEANTAFLHRAVSLGRWITDLDFGFVIVMIGKRYRDHTFGKILLVEETQREIHLRDDFRCKP